MSSSASPRSAVLLLAVGAVAFALVGWRVLSLEQTERERRAQRRSGLAVARAKADADRLAKAPRGRPLAAWRIEPGTAVSAGVADGAGPWARLRRAAGEHGRPAAALRAFEALLGPGQPAWVQDVAALEAGLLLARAGREADAQERWTRAVGASDLLVGLGGERVRLAALRHLALSGLRRGEPARLRQLLDETQDGVRLADDDVLGPARSVILLAESLSAGARAHLAPADRRRLEHAVTHARRGLRLMSKLASDGAVFEEGAVAWRQGARLRLFPATSFVEPALSGFEPDFVLEGLPRGAPLPAGALRLAAPLEGVIVRPVPVGEASRIGWWVALALGLGMLVYAVGAAVALAGWRRSRTAAAQQADFTAAVSHELKTPIASVRAMAELLGDGGVQDPLRAQRYAQRIEAEMQRLGSTVRNVLDAANVERGSLPVLPEPGDPAAWLERMAALLRPALEAKGFVLTLEAEPAPGAVAFDRAALEGVLMNLVDNAAKFSGARKQIGMRGAPRLGGGYRFEVLDRGIGLGNGDPEDLFRRYYRGSAAREGAIPGVGLGLHIAREVVRAHGGQLLARARAGGGAAFVIDLPGASAR